MTRRRSSRSWGSLACVLVFWAGTLVNARMAGQDATTPALAVAGDVRTPMTIALRDLSAMPRTSVDVTDEDGRTVRYEGVLVGELLRRAGATLGSSLRGDALTTYVLASASDGYQVVFSLAELDPAFTSSRVIVADTIDGKPLFGFQGPFRIVSPGDARPARSIRMLQRLDVVRVRQPR